MGGIKQTQNEYLSCYSYKIHKTMRGYDNLTSLSFGHKNNVDKLYFYKFVNNGLKTDLENMGFTQ